MHTVFLRRHRLKVTYIACLSQDVRFLCISEHLKQYRTLNGKSKRIWPFIHFVTLHTMHLYELVFFKYENHYPSMKVEHLTIYDSSKMKSKTKLTFGPEKRKGNSAKCSHVGHRSHEFPLCVYYVHVSDIFFSEY
jgi:hypothetical protein